MTTDVHDHSQHAAVARVAPMGRSRPRWLIPGVIALVTGAGLVLAGVIPFSTAVSAGLIGGMLLMHLGGHGGHGGHGADAADGPAGGAGQSGGTAPVQDSDKPARPGGCH